MHVFSEQPSSPRRSEPGPRRVLGVVQECRCEPARGRSGRRARPVLVAPLPQGHHWTAAPRVAVGALAAAVLAIGGVVTAVVRFVDGDDSRRIGPATDEEQRIENQSAEADELVGFLIDHDEGAVQLNHQVIAPAGRTTYRCSTPATSPPDAASFDCRFPIRPDRSQPIVVPGCYLVLIHGAGYQAAPLDPRCTGRPDLSSRPMTSANPSTPSHRRWNVLPVPTVGPSCQQWPPISCPPR